MKPQGLFAATLAVALLTAAGGAWAHGRVHFGIHVGPPVWGPGWYYPPPYYYPPPVVVVPRPAPPPVYIEQADPAAQPVEPPQQYWYYCKSGKGYYPYVKECPDGWQKVLPQPEK